MKKKINFSRSMMQLEKAGVFIRELLNSRIPAHYYYHNYAHTTDVLHAAVRLAGEEGITNETDLSLLKTAALFHDSGYVNTYENHEEESCRIATEVLPGFGYTSEQAGIACNMIMKTKLPSNPETILEKILCDADLDYLGRDDFFTTGKNLFEELFTMKKISGEKEWNELQIKFLRSHQYWTQSAKAAREKRKLENLKQLTIDN